MLLIRNEKEIIHSGSLFEHRNRQVLEKRNSRNKRRRFRGNQSVSEPPKKGNAGVAAKSGGKGIPSVSKQQPATPTEGIRSRKIKPTQINEENIDKDDYYICINFSVLQKLFM